MTTKLRNTTLLALVACFALLVSGCSSDGGGTAPIVNDDPIIVDDPPVVVEDTTPPTTPVNLGAFVTGDEVTLAWTENSEIDLDGYNVYRSIGEDRVFSLLGTCDTARYTDTVSGRNIISVSYKVSAIDASGNESAQTISIDTTVDMTEPIPEEWQPPVDY